MVLGFDKRKKSSDNSVILAKTIDNRLYFVVLDFGAIYKDNHHAEFD